MGAMRQGDPPLGRRGIAGPSSERSNEMANNLSGSQAISMLERAGLKQCDADRVHVRAGGYFFHQGERARHVYVLLEGRARLVEVTSSGQEVLLRALDEGDFFCPAALGGKLNYEATAQALDDSVAARIEVSVLARSMRESPVVAQEIILSLVNQMSDLQHRFRDLVTEGVPQRLAKALLSLAKPHGGNGAHRGNGGNGTNVESGSPPEIVATGHDLADLAATTSYTVSRWISKWCVAGLLRRTRESILIMDGDRLRGVAEGVESPNVSAPDAV